MNIRPHALFAVFRKRFPGLSPWLLLGMALILGLAIAVLAIKNAQKEKEYMTQYMVNRAETLIWALEAGTRTWMGMRADDSRWLQSLVEEAAKQSGIMFIAVVDGEGDILAHSDASLIGGSLEKENMPLPQDAGASPSWRIQEWNGAMVFTVFRSFTPFSNGHHSQHRRRDWCGWRPAGRGAPRAIAGTAPARADIALVGLDRRPFEQALAQDFRNSVFFAGLVAAMGLAGVVSLFLAHNHRAAEIKRLQAEAQRNERLTALGRLASGVAHEIRNPLSTIKGVATYLAKRMQPGGREEEAANAMMSEVDRLNRVVSELLDFARPAAIIPAENNLREVVDRALRLAEADIRAKRIKVHIEESPGFPPVFISPERFTQVLLNLFLNAVQAMEADGELRVAMRRNPGDGVFSVSVADNGKGIPEDEQAAIFTPYFTTKPSGAGLGLAIVHQIVEGHGGSIRVDSAPGAGAEFTVTLPLKEGTWRKRRP